MFADIGRATRAVSGRRTRAALESRLLNCLDAWKSWNIFPLPYLWGLESQLLPLPLERSSIGRPEDDNGSEEGEQKKDKDSAKVEEILALSDFQLRMRCRAAGVSAEGIELAEALEKTKRERERLRVAKRLYFAETLVRSREEEMERRKRGRRPGDVAPNAEEEEEDEVRTAVSATQAAAVAAAAAAAAAAAQAAALERERTARKQRAAAEWSTVPSGGDGRDGSVDMDIGEVSDDSIDGVPMSDDDDDLDGEAF